MRSTASASSAPRATQPSPQRRRMLRRALRHHLALALASGALMIAFGALSRANDWHLRWSIATAYASLALLGATLLLGPLNVLRARPNPVSTDLRRDIGIWSALLGLAHVLIVVSVYGLPIRQTIIRFVIASGQRAARVEWPVIANDLGLVATVILALLLALSNDRALRALRPRRWKALQRWAYPLFALVVAHGVLFQMLERRAPLFVIGFWALVAVVVLAQAAGARRRSRGAARDR